MKKQVPGLACPLDHEYSVEEWQACLRCAREGMASGERLHKEFYAEIAGHWEPAREVERSVRADSSLIRYINNEGCEALALWDPHSRLFVVGTVPDGLVLTAFPLDDEEHFERYVGRFRGLRWLRR